MENAKIEKYRSALEQAAALIDTDCGSVTNMANICALLKQEFNFWWCGFYLVKNPGILELGPFQGPVACTRIPYGKGVCGTAWKKNETIIVPDVHKFEGHIACSAISNSEIVLPLRDKNSVWGVLDIDSEFYDHFDAVDAEYLRKICDLLQA